ncbi:MAG: hypothetical protein RL616_748, partial [Verrucomicrobiota bacterium]
CAGDETQPRTTPRLLHKRPSRRVVGGDVSFAPNPRAGGAGKSLPAKTLRHRPAARRHRKSVEKFIQSGQETILWTPLAVLTEIVQPYAVEKDIAFFATPPHVTPIHLRAGDFAIFFPTDGHAPGLEYGGRAKVRKTVIKVRV